MCSSSSLLIQKKCFCRILSTNIFINQKPFQEKLTKDFYHAQHILTIKGYLFYETITSENAPSEAQIKNFFASQKSYVPFSRCSTFCILNHSMIFQICHVMMSMYKRQGAFWNISFQPQLINPPNLANLQIYVRAIFF